MNKEELQKIIEQRLEDRKISVLNKNAFSALFGAFSDPISALGKIFLGRQDALELEQQNIVQDIIIEMLCEIDTAISTMNREARTSGVMNIIDGIIDINVKDSESATGIHISGSKAVEFKPGTHIKMTSSGVSNVTALKIEG